jgi:hypothetical protein
MSTRDEAMSPQTIRRLIDAADRPLKLRKVTINLAAAATGHRKHPHGTSCETCREKWPCVDIQRAISPILRAVDDMLDFHDETTRRLATSWALNTVADEFDATDLPGGYALDSRHVVETLRERGKSLAERGRRTT